MLNHFYNAKLMRLWPEASQFFNTSIGFNGKLRWTYKSARPFNRDAYIVVRDHVFKRLWELKDRSLVHVPTGNVKRRLRILYIFVKRSSLTARQASLREEGSEFEFVHFDLHSITSCFSVPGEGKSSANWRTNSSMTLSFSNSRRPGTK